MELLLVDSQIKGLVSQIKEPSSEINKILLKNSRKRGDLDGKDPFAAKLCPNAGNDDSKRIQQSNYLCSPW
jgi:hypothetical protein